MLLILLWIEVGSNLSPAHALPGDVKEEISEMIDDGTEFSYTVSLGSHVARSPNRAIDQQYVLLPNITKCANSLWWLGIPGGN